MSLEYGRGKLKFEDGASTNGDSNALRVNGWHNLTVQVWGNTGATTTIKGRLDENAPWETWQTFTSANGKVVITGTYVEIMATISSYVSGGPVHVAVAGVDLNSLLRSFN